MTQQDTLRILAMLHSFYGRPKADPTDVAQAWYLILKDYDYEMTKNAVLKFAENDTRDYASFPAPGVIIKLIRAEENKRLKSVMEITSSIGRGKPYEQLSDMAKQICSSDMYHEWLRTDPVKFISNQSTYEQILLGNLKMLGGSND